MSPDCMDQALIQNGWSTQAEIVNMKEGNKKMLLYSKISFHFASDYHTQTPDRATVWVPAPQGDAIKQTGDVQGYYEQK